MSSNNNVRVLNKALQNLEVIVQVFDTNNQLLFMNDAALKDLSLSHQEQIKAKIAGGESALQQFEHKASQRWYECYRSAITWQDGRLVRLLVAQDITQRKVSEQKLQKARQEAERLAYTDELTELNNRRAFIKLSTEAIQREARLKKEVALVFFDLDYFKEVNDTFGHAAGDILLRSIGQALRPALRKHDVAGRIGGEEFAVLLTNANYANALKATQRIQRIVNAVSITYKSSYLQCTASFGITSMPACEASASELMLEADKALYLAKSGGRNRIQAFSGTHVAACN